MAETPSGPRLEEVPEAVAVARPAHRLPLVWIVPIVAVLVGGWLAVKTILSKGPTATISFRTAEGLEVGKTKIKFKDVDIGTVTDIRLSPDYSGVIVTAQFRKEAEEMMVKDTRFWVVRARISGGGVSGLSTLLSGAYIGADVGRSKEPSSTFVGLEVPPILTGGLPGREFVLHADNLGSIGYATPVYYRRLQVGEVTAYNVDEDGSGVSIKIFVHAPYDRFVTTETRFWQASGIDFSLTAKGIQIETQSVASILLGGIAFGTPPHAPVGERAGADSLFSLAANRVAAYTKEERRVYPVVFVFNESVRGLDLGAPVDFRGITVGEVTRIDVDYVPDGGVNIPVEANIFPDRIKSRLREKLRDETLEERKARLDHWIALGFRGQLRTGSLLTGSKYVAFDIFPDAPKAKIDWNTSVPQIPTIPGGLDELQASIARIATKLEKVPYEEIGNELRTALESLNATLRGVDQLVQRLNTETAPEVQATLVEARRALATADKVLASVGRTVAPDAALTTEAREALREITRAAAALRTLADYLERHPEALIRGKEPK